MKKEIKQKLLFNGATFEKRANFKNLIFREDVSFSNARLKDDVYFNNSEFEQKADFHESEYERVACFYGVRFDQPPNFSQSIFKGSINLVNSELSFDFEQTRERISEEHERRQQEQEFFKIANDFRDSFRSFKGALIRDNNLLDAQEYHRLELYCKEIELDSREPKAFSKDWIDKWQLCFYRITSEHHTNLLKIFNNIILLIALFGMFVFGLMGIKDSDSAQTSLAGILSSLCMEQKVSYFIFGDLNKEHPLELFLISYAVFTLLYGISQLVKYFRGDKEKKKDKIWLWIFIGFFFILFGGVAGYFLMKKFQSFREVFVIFLVCSVFVLMYLGLMLNRNIILTIYSYLVCIVILIIKPALLLPLFGKLFDESLKIDYPAINSLGVMYSILMFLLLFSLQKTARKNSIIPS